ncbi:hypothetical protein [Granulibacter bethesdensis]|uniref:Uncharacterized protein n=1 Tax=Granulibacter bethesdensis (strain ATCC BAA-1260 / CGDNIH1) TaxID=391165 RepID=Q0BRC0_GRABC|nr:hypothetical protein [Granulibacter bethesdensis]ABI62632.1 Hypothetical protein GbCGDNIH1_1734 [Granulibacter bethesdensis CGDNIH1]AHJ65788.1 Hypothetical protein GbCGDNIH4_1734 [Granulibacter bethesdensis CGDNIH4]APH52487.1 Hypothetical protein GbCGDNIH5_1734 [Granulibacter bethesdensis]APH60090.1 Hypothetical protein GbCGDNIH7_1734 [Granulibacter bethesdensis]APH65176.1 Hypothetical protein GbCGDNIH1I4_1734 [Granulibacter bethesdensis]
MAVDPDPDPVSQALPDWTAPDGAPVTCAEKRRVLAENHRELAQVMQDAYEDAILMGVDPDMFRRSLLDMVQALKSPLHDS